MLTGATGFLGRHVVKEFRNEQWRTIAISREKAASNVIQESLEIASIDSSSTTDECVEFFSQLIGPVCLVHLAAHYSGLHTTSDVSKLVESNIHFPVRLVDALSRSKPGSRVINISTLFQRFENKAYSPVSLYAASKESFLKLLDFYAESDLLKVIDVTFGDTYGLNDVRGKLMNLLIVNVGSINVINLGSGNQNMSLTHIVDVARGIMQVIKYDDSIARVGVWRVQIPPTDNITVRNLITLIEKVTSKKVACDFNPARDRKRELYSPITNLEPLPNYAPTIVLEDGIKEMFEAKKS